MKRLFLAAGALLLGASPWAAAQTSLDVIQDDLRAAKAQHDDANSQIMTAFLSALTQADQSPSAALDLYQKAGGSLAKSAPVSSRYDYETPTEREQREAVDAANLQAQSSLIQVHCGLMRNAALLAVTPQAAGVRQQWIEWLKATAPIYPQLVPPPAPPVAPAPADGDQGTGGRHHHHADGDTNETDPSADAPKDPPKPPPSVKNIAMRDSVVSQYLGFHGWGESEQGKWAVKDLPRLYRELVLEPLRQPPGAETLNAWNVYIAMRQADQPDDVKWTQEEEPPLDFDRAADDFTVQPTMDKLSALDAIIKANPTNDHLDNWLARMQTMINVYRGGPAHAAVLPGATPSTPSSEASAIEPMATPGTSSSEAAGSRPAATPGAPAVITTSQTPDATPGTPSSQAAGLIPTATPGAPAVTPGGAVPAATPGVSSPSSAGLTPAATPGSPSSGTTAAVPAASPGTPSSAAPGPLPAATPGSPASGTTVPRSAP